MRRAVWFWCLLAMIVFVAHEVRAEDYHAKADSLNRLASRLKDEGRYDEADRVYRQAVADESLKSEEATSQRDKLQINWCDLYLRRGMYETANELLDSILLSNKENENSIEWNRQKASTLIYLGKYEEAKELYGKLIKRFEKNRPKGYNTERDSAMFREALYNQGYWFAEVGRCDSAVAYMRRAIDVEIDIKKKNIYLSNLAVQEARLGLFDNATSNIDGSLAYFKDNYGTSHPEYIITLRKKAEILLMAGQRAKATDIFADYVEKERRQAVKEFAFFTEQKRLDYWKNKRPLISEIFQTEDEQPATLFDVSIFRREVSLLGGADSVDIPRRLALRGKDIRKSLKKGEVAVDFIKYAKDSINRYAALVAYPANDRRDVQFVPLWTEEELNGYPVGYSTLKDAVCSRLVSDKNTIYGDSVLARFVWGKIMPNIVNATDVYFCPDGLLNMLAVEYLPLDDTKPRFYRLTSFSKLTERGKRRKTTGRMLAVGGLDYNDEAEGTGSAAGGYNHDAIDYLHRQVGMGRLFSYLSGTKEEIEAIDSCVGRRLPLETACVKTEDEIKKELACGKYSALHLSTHGYSLSVDVDEGSEMFRDSISEDRSLIASGIALSGANVAYKNGDGEDGILSARELCDMNLKQVDVVVLSACQTALGVVSDEGPAGLVRGLKKSGANTIIATLWEVDDAATKLLMSYFYGILSSRPEMSMTEALSEARDSTRSYRLKALSAFNPATLSSTVEYVKYKDEDNEPPITPYEAPYYWAPFIVIDDYIKN